MPRQGWAHGPRRARFAWCLTCPLAVPLLPRYLRTGLAGRTRQPPTVRDGYRVAVTVSPDTDAPLPWWRSPLNVTLAAVVLVVIGFAIGTFLPRGDDPTVHNEVDTGFLQDMRVHHEQAITMAIVYRGIASVDREPLDPVLRTIALEIHMSQGVEVGRIVQLLRLFGEAETNESGQTMGWMGHPMPLEEMPGLASDEDLDRLHAARGAEADRLFGTLMIAHHRGGVEMAEYAAENAANPEVRALARSMVTGQSGEIAELESILSR